MSAPLIGIDGRKIPGAAERGPLGSLHHARELGMQGVFFRTVLDMSPTLDGGELTEIRAVADELGLYLESGLGKVNPYAIAEAPELRRAGDGDVVLGFRRMMEACAAIGCLDLWVGTGNFKSAFRGRYASDRFRTDVTWSEQLHAVGSFLATLAPIARDLGIHIDLETHEEITSFEVVRLVEQVGPDVAGIVFDTGNMLQRLEDPVATARRVAPYVRQTHIKDAVLAPVPGGLRFQLRPCGAGVVDLAAILPILLTARPGLTLTMECDQPREDPTIPALDMLVEAFDPDFVAAHPDLDPAEYARYLRLADESEARVRAGEIPDVATYAAAPYRYTECVRFIRDSAAHLRALCADLVTTGGPR